MEYFSPSLEEREREKKTKCPPVCLPPHDETEVA